MKFRGSSASLRDLAVYDIAGRDGTDCPAGTVAAGGILVDAVATTVESLTVSNVFLYFFLGGPAVSLVARNNAGIAFGNYQNVRVRHAKTGIYLKAEEGSFVNSNSFFAGGMVSLTRDRGRVIPSSFADMVITQERRRIRLGDLGRGPGPMQRQQILRNGKNPFRGIATTAQRLTLFPSSLSHPTQRIRTYT